MTNKLNKIRQIAKNKNIKGKISISNRKNKKYKIELENGKIIHWGAKGMSDFLDHQDIDRLKRFHNRFKNNKGYNNKNSGLYYSSRLLW